MLAGCSKELADEPQGTAKPGEQVTVTFGASISAEASEMSAMQGADSSATRAFTSAYIGRIGVLDNANSWATDCDNISLSIAQNETMTAAAAVLTAGQSYSFHSVAVPDGKALPAKADTYDLTFGEQTAGSDLIYAKVDAKTISGDEKITFAYKHVYGKVKFVLSKGANVTDEQLATATLTVSGYYRAGTLDMKTGTITNGAAGTDVAIAKETQYYALPQTFTAGSEATANVTIADKTYSGKITTGNITAGKLTTVTIKVNVEAPALSPKVGDYYYLDGSFSTTFETDSPLLGVVYQVKGKYGMLVEVTEGQVECGGTLPTEATDMTNGQENMRLINILEPESEYSSYPAFKRCADKNAGGINHWYLPARDELVALENAYNSYGETAFNALMTAPGVNGTKITTGYHFSSTEYLAPSCYCVVFGSNHQVSTNQKFDLNYSRCVRAF